jgi:hypothetical protein
MKFIKDLTFILVFRILEVYFFPFGSEATVIIKLLLHALKGRSINLNIQPLKLF